MLNQKGSVLSVALIMITLLTFSLAGVSAYSFRVAENTNRVVERNDQENEAKFLIDQAITYFKIETANFSQDFFENFEENLADANIIETIEDLYGVLVSDAGKISSSGSESEFIARSYRFAYDMPSGRRISKVLYATYGGQEFEEFNTYLFAGATNANYFSGGGEYYSANIYGRWVDINFTVLDYDQETYRLLDGTGSNYPFFYESNIISENYGACIAADGCFTEDTGSFTLVLNDENSDRGDLGFPLFDDIFRGFDLQTHMETVMFDSFGVTYGDYAAIDTSSQGHINSEGHINGNRIIEGDLVIDSAGAALDLRGNLLIITGDLTIKDTTRIHGDGVIVVKGEFNIHNGDNLELNITIFSEGRTHIRFDETFGFTPQRDNPGFALFSKENIIIDYNQTPVRNNNRVKLFIFSNESILINATRQDMKYKGVMYAAAKSEADPDKGLINSDLHPDIYILRDTLLKPFHGVMINSFNGTYTTDEEGETIFSPGEQNEDFDGWSPGMGRPPWSGGGGGTNPGGGTPTWSPPGQAAGGTHRYSVNGLYDGASGDVTGEFLYVPSFGTLLLYVGDISFETGTFHYE